jgi:D-alanyl-D-alanine dipeptidase
VPPAGFVVLDEALPGVRLDPRYASADNFTGAPLPGYGRPTLWALEAVAVALAQVRVDLAQDGLDIMIYDAYRPVRASRAMVAWTQRTGQGSLLVDGYIAPRSGHNHGHTVDLTLVHRDTGVPLDMGGAWDTFSEVSHVGSATGPAADHRKRLQAAMRAAGFRPYSKEWWHFRLPVGGTVPLDLPYGCEEPAVFTPPPGWETPGWTPGSP